MDRRTCPYLHQREMLWRKQRAARTDCLVVVVVVEEAGPHMQVGSAEALRTPVVAAAGAVLRNCPPIDSEAKLQTAVVAVVGEPRTPMYSEARLQTAVVAGAVLRNPPMYSEAMLQTVVVAEAVHHRSLEAEHW